MKVKGSFPFYFPLAKNKYLCTEGSMSAGCLAQNFPLLLPTSPLFV